MTPRETEVMQVKNAMQFLMLTVVIGLWIMGCPAWGEEIASLLIMPIAVGFLQFVVVGVNYHAKAEFGLPRKAIWATCLPPLTMFPALWLSPADNEPAACCFLVANAVSAFCVIRKAPVEGWQEAALPAIENDASEPEPSVSMESEIGELPEALEHVQQVIQMQDATPEEKMRELHQISSMYAERVGDLPVVS